jgi:putative mRNA 3-end processing factor
LPPHPQSWLKTTPNGLYCEPGDFYIDPLRPVPRAVITHAHADHARPGHEAVLATAGTLAVMRTRMGAERAGGVQQSIAYRQPIKQNDVTVTLFPAGHVLGSAQILMEYKGARAVVSGDYKRQADPTCEAFEPVPCDVFVTEATFGLPVFHHPAAADELTRLLASVSLFPERTHVIGCYALGKCQRVIGVLREIGYDKPIYLHGAHVAVCNTYREQGVDLGDLRPATVANKLDLAGAVVLAPPSAIADRWARRLEDPVVCMASGWMRIRQRAKAGGIELPLIISDHADWDDLLTTIREVGAPEIWVTHGSEEALIHAASRLQIRAKALRLVGYGDEDEV